MFAKSIFVQTFAMAFALATTGLVHAYDTPSEGTTNWTFTRALPEGTRGGSSNGPAVELDNTVPESWSRLRAEGISSYERDRRAIYALEGEFQVKFEFLETFLMETDKGLDTPYSSWATEFVKVIEDRGDFISLQHIIVMFFKNSETGEVEGPHIVKHWRQDWQWEPTTRFEFLGDRKWEINKVENGKGLWSWSVFQVDDSPRYTGLGKWQHFESASIFSTDMMNRPLPRREFSVRSDYKVLLGGDQLIVNPTSWFHEQKGLKNVQTMTHSKDYGTFRSREIGHNSYLRIKNFDWSAGYTYWNQTKGYWADVRAVWNEVLSTRTKYGLKKSADGKPLFMHHFTQAADPAVQAMSSAERKVLIRTTLNKFLLDN